jgi:predicted dehydrogenase
VTPLRIGVLGAARIAPAALMRPARVVDGVAVTAVAARDPRRARRFAERYRVATVHPDYAAVLADPEVDAVYVPLPNGLHAEWILAALAAGKHVLCEKPLTSNAAQAREVADAADRSGLVVMEAFHYRYHPLMARVRQLLDEGAVGRIRRMRASFCFLLYRSSDIRYRLDLAGGATMDAGCYPVSLLRFLAGTEPEVVSARAELRSPGVDRAMTAHLRFPGADGADVSDGIDAEMVASLWSRRLLGISAQVWGDAGRLRVFNYLMPAHYHRLTWHSGGRTHRERVPGEATYTHQLRAFLSAVRDGGPVPTSARDGVANMAVIDGIYRAAGLEPRS